jgi:hypothetical protein
MRTNLYSKIDWKKSYLCIILKYPMIWDGR